MEQFSIKRILVTVGIIVILVFMIGLTYIHFNFEKEEEKELVDLNKYVNVVFSDTSNVTFINAKKDDNVSKSFTVKNIYNKTIYYSIILSNVTNNYDRGSFIYTLTSDTGAYIDNAYISNDNYTLSSLIRLDSGKEHNYHFDIKLISENDLNKTFSSNIKVNVITADPLYDNNSLYSYIVNNKVKLFNNSEEDNENGVYYTNNSINGNTVYFFRGNNDLNNNVLLGNYCYKIIRTTEDLGVKMIYNGKFNKGVCDGTDNVLEQTAFNNNSNYNAYVGYSYGSPNSVSYQSEHENNNASNVMKNVNDFYKNNLIEFTSYILDTTYCNNRKTASFVLDSVKYSTLGYKNYNTGYESMNRLLNNEYSYNCENISDRLTSKITSYPIGMLTVDEAMFAGLNKNNKNEDNYLNTTTPYWTLSPAYYNGINAYNFIIKDGIIGESEVNKVNGVRPVITLRKNVNVLSGNGKVNNPYRLGV